MRSNASTICSSSGEPDDPIVLSEDFQMSSLSVPANSRATCERLRFIALWARIRTQPSLIVRDQSVRTRMHTLRLSEQAGGRMQNHRAALDAGPAVCLHM